MIAREARTGCHQRIVGLVTLATTVIKGLYGKSDPVGDIRQSLEFSLRFSPVRLPPFCLDGKSPNISVILPKIHPRKAGLR